ncbi:hypothetical protein [Hymenobacter rubripertinctus]|nr:hypothetical protein [Hymenobacter rubripertinctus]
MYQKLPRLLFFFMLLLSTQAAVAQSKPTYQYMQLFYYGNGPVLGAIGRFSPALRGETYITLTKPTTYQQQLIAIIEGPVDGQIQTSYTGSDGAGGIFIDGRKLTPAEARQMKERENREQKEAEKKRSRMMTEHTDAITERLMQSINNAAEDGWEVVQMTGTDSNGLVYLLRKAK